MHLGKDCILKKYFDWLLFTVLVGLIPILLRLFFSIFVVRDVSFPLIALSDIIAWSLISNISIFHERNNLFKFNPKISDFSKFISCIIIVISIILYTLNLLNDAIKIKIKETLLEEKYLFLADYIICFVTLVVSIGCCFFSIGKIKRRLKKDAKKE
jgi:amino acid permease